MNNICDGFNDYPVTFFNGQQNCIDYVRSRSKSEIIFLITSIAYAIEILPQINDLRQLDSAFIYSNEEEYKTNEDCLDKYLKVIGVYFQLEDLYASIQKNIEYATKNIESFKFYEQHQKSTRQLSQEAGSFLWLRLFKDVILKLPHDEQAKQEMTEKLKECYHNNNKQLKCIERFSQEYKPENAILWYTCELFLYTQINRALRTEDIDLLYTFRYFISDLSRNLSIEYELLKDLLDSTITLYRGVKLVNEETKKLKENIGKLISTNGYLSASFSKDVALTFSGESTEDATSVLFQIKYDLGNINSIIVASVAHINRHQNEDEVLFDLDAAFEILSVEKDESLNKLVVTMKATDQGSILAQEHIKEHRRQIDTTSVILVYGRLLTEIGQYDKSQQYYERLLEKPNEEDLSFIYYYLGAIHYHKGQYEKAIQYYESSYDTLINTALPREGTSAYVLNDIGAILSNKGQYENALDYYRRALKISEKLSNYRAISISLSNIGIIYRIKGEYDLALDYHMECHRIQEQYLPSEHKEIARTLDHIAAVYNDKDDLSSAMIYNEKSLKINETCLPVGHDYIGSSFQHIATVLINQGKYDQALDYYDRSLKNKEHIFPNGHLSIVKILCKTGYVYYLKRDYDLALDYLTKAMKMREILFSDVNDISLMYTFTYFGLVFVKQQKLDDALLYFTRAFDLAQILLPTGHEDITDCLTNIGISYRDMKKFDKAFEYFEKAGENEEQNCIKPNLIRLARIHDNMGICLCDQGIEKVGLDYRMKAVKLIDQILPRRQHADWIDTIANEFLKNNLYDGALKCYLISLNMRRKCLPDDHTDIADSLMLLGDVYMKKDSPIEARGYYEKALIVYESKEHFNSIDVFNCIGLIYENIHEYHLAFKYYEKAYTFSEKYFPENILVKLENEKNIVRVQPFVK